MHSALVAGSRVEIVVGDITNQDVDAIENAANSSLLEGDDIATELQERRVGVPAPRQVPQKRDVPDVAAKVARSGVDPVEAGLPWVPRVPLPLQAVSRQAERAASERATTALPEPQRRKVLQVEIGSRVAYECLPEKVPKRRVDILPVARRARRPGLSPPRARA